MSMSITEWPEQERPRERLISHGAENLSSAELLAVIFGCGARGKTALDLARDLLNHQKSLRKLLNSDRTSLMKIQGIGLAKYCQLQAAVELGKRYMQEPLTRHGMIKHAKDAEHFLTARLRDLEQEVFACLFLDSKNHIIAFEKLFYGTIHSANIHPREVVKRALHYNASAVIAAHNHPSGNAEPSQADRIITTELAQALRLVEIQLLDHFIVGDPKVVALAERGLLA